MKRTNLFSIALSALIAASAPIGLTSCDALWGTSVDVGSGSPYDSYYGWDGEWLPTLAGAPLISPYYWGGSAYPVGNYGPVYRPGESPWGNQIGNRPVTLPSNTPVGTVRPGIGSGIERPNIRPSQSEGNTPMVLPDIKGANPGIVMPPAGSGYKPVQGRH